MSEKRLKLKFVNEGKAFSIPSWTTKKHETALDKLVKDTKDLPDKEKDREFKFYVIHESLLEVDPNCKMEDVRAMHPTDTVDLFSVLYNAGRTGIWEEDFPVGEKEETPKKKK
jgi:hypothetical protein